jgi:hypothetical protein
MIPVRIVLWTVIALTVQVQDVIASSVLSKQQILLDEIYSDREISRYEDSEEHRRLGLVQYCRCEASWEHLYRGRRLNFDYNYDSAQLDYQGFVIIEGVRVIPKIADQCTGEKRTSGSTVSRESSSSVTSAADYRGNSRGSTDTTPVTRTVETPLNLDVTKSAEELKKALETFDFGTGKRKADVSLDTKSSYELKEIFKSLGNNRRLDERKLMGGSKRSKGYYGGIEYGKGKGKGKGGYGFYYDSYGYAQGTNLLISQTVSSLCV